MSDRDPQGEHHDCGADAAAYSLGALEPAEAAAFREHLVDCAVCRDELSAFQAVADVLPLSAPSQRVPRSLKRRVMAEVKAGTPQRVSGRRVPTRAWVPSPVLGAVALAAVVLVSIGAVALLSGGTSTRVVDAAVTWHGTAVVRVSGGRGELVVNGMPAPPAGKVYEVWLQRRGQVLPTSALFTVTAVGAGNVDVPGNLNGVSRVMVTPEPAGGSRTPTHAPVLVANLT